MTHEPLPRPPLYGRLVARAALNFVLGVLAAALLLFVPAGTLDYWEAWLYLAVLFLPVLVFGSYLLVKDPELVERRMRTREVEIRQRQVVRLSFLPFLLGFLIPGLDQRFGWSEVPAAVVLAADLVVLVGYALFVRVLQVNRFAARVVAVEAGQELATTGPYARVRHPMYAAMIVMCLATPVALGSWWGVLPMLAIVPILALRIRNEEEVLLLDLPGYRDYTQQVRFRLVPGLW
jgi:protein-S-isoprenylcysteine O-methyltransferase Ste14